MCPACVPRRTARQCKRAVSAGHRNSYSEALSGAFAMLLLPAASDCSSVGCGLEAHPRSRNAAGRRPFLADGPASSSTPGAMLDPLTQAAGDEADCIAYLIGNHVVVERMFRNDPRAILYAPLRAVVWED